MSGGSRDARDVLAQIRSVINHLEQKDRKLNEKLKTWESFKNGNEPERIKGLIEEVASLKEAVRQKSDYSGRKMEEISRLKVENSDLQGLISAKDAEINKLAKDLTFEQFKFNIIEKENKTLTENLKKCEADLLDTRGEMNSYSSAYDQVIEEKTALQTKNLELEQTIRRLQATAASTDQTQLQKEYSDLLEEFNKVKAESKQNKDIADNNYQSADQYKNLYEETKKEKEIIQEQIVKLQRGGVSAGSLNLQSPHKSFEPIAARLDVEPPKNPIVSAKDDTSQKHPASQPAAQAQKGIVAEVVGGVWNAFGFGGGGTAKNSVDEGKGKKDPGKGSGGGNSESESDSGSDDSSDDGKASAEGSHSGGPAGGAAAGGGSSGRLSPEYAVNGVVKNNGIEDTAAAAASAGSKTQVGGDPAAAAASKSQFGGVPAAAAGGGGHAVVDVDEIIKKATEEVDKNKVIDMLKLSLTEMKQDERLFKLTQRTNEDGTPKTRKQNGKNVADTYYEVFVPNMAVSGVSAQQNVYAYCNSLNNAQLIALENLYGVKGDTRDESINKLESLKKYISLWSTVHAAERDKLIALCNNKRIPYPDKTVPEIAEWFKKHARTDGLRQEIYDILDS